ncbi:hypothetical protein [Actinomadura macra]|uniref:hypothetical protein n=1 Tax=Actinomadura macra TaxID=46164 RepID=UPI0012F78557|nr:hypothetical protein [Actinomadura macra]
MSTQQSTGTGPRVRAPSGRCPPAGRLMGLPAPLPAQVRAARAHLTPLHATGVDAVMWEARRHPMPDRAAISAVIAASEAARSGTGVQPEPLQVAAALVLLGAVRLEMDQTEARLLDTAQAAAMGWEQIAAVLDMGVAEAEERFRSLKPRLDEPVAHVAAPFPGAAPHRGPTRGHAPNWDGSARTQVWDEWDEQAGEGRSVPEARTWR